MHRAVDEMADAGTFRGYGPEQGYAFLREKVAEVKYARHGARIDKDEIFISDGAKCDTGNFQELFAMSNKVAVTDPVYPVYVDSNVMAGRGGKFTEGKYEGLTYLPCVEQNNFVPEIPVKNSRHSISLLSKQSYSMVISRADLKKWVEYAHENKTISPYDAYEAYIKNPDYRIPFMKLRADEVAVEFNSFSKSAAFAGERSYCSAQKVMAYTASNEARPLHAYGTEGTAPSSTVFLILSRGAEAALPMRDFGRRRK